MSAVRIPAKTNTRLSCPKGNRMIAEYSNVLILSIDHMKNAGVMIFRAVVVDGHGVIAAADLADLTIDENYMKMLFAEHNLTT